MTCGTHRVTMCYQTTPHTTHDTHKGRGNPQEKERAGRRRRRPPDRRHVSLGGCAACSPHAHALDVAAASPERAPPAERGDNLRFPRVGLLPHLSPLLSAADPEGTARGTDTRQVNRMRACAVRGNTHLGGSVGRGEEPSRREDLRADPRPRRRGTRPRHSRPPGASRPRYRRDTARRGRTTPTGRWVARPSRGRCTAPEPRLSVE